MPIFTLKKDQNSLTQFFLYQGICSFFATVLILCVSTPIDKTSFVISQILVWISLVSIGIAVYLFFLKKNIALLIGVIVFKWPILILLVYKMTTIYRISSVSFSLGLLPLILGSFVWSFTHKE